MPGMQCPWCGAPAEPNEVYCYNCGGALAPGGAGPSADQTRVMPTAASPTTAPTTGPARADATQVLPPVAAGPAVLPSSTRPPANRPPGWLAGALLGLLLLAGLGLFLLLRDTGTEGSISPLPPSPTPPPTTVAPPETTVPGPTMTSAILPTTSIITSPATTVAPSTSTPPATTQAPAPTPQEPATSPAPTTSPAPAVTAAPTTRAPAPTTTRPPAPTTTTRPPAPSTTSPPSSVAPPDGAVAIQSVRASATRPPSTDGCGQRTNYAAANLVDNTRSTAWMAPGDGTGVTITLRLSGGRQNINYVGLVPGYDKIDECTGSDRFTELRRVSKVRWAFSDGVTVEQTLNIDDRSMQVLEIPEGSRSNSVTLTILETVAPGVERLNHTPISDVVVGLH